MFPEVVRGKVYRWRSRGEADFENGDRTCILTVKGRVLNLTLEQSRESMILFFLKTLKSLNVSHPPITQA